MWTTLMRPPASMHLAYLCGGRLETWRWRRGVLTRGPVFTPDQGGIDAFADYMVEQGRPPVRLLADLVEEDFHRVLLPHVRGRAGRNLLARRLQQHYRETPYRRAALQGREPESISASASASDSVAGPGRRDDIVLMSALTNPVALQQWTEALTLVQAPLAGIWSCALLCAALPPMLGFMQAHVLLVTWQSCGMRQSYFRDGQLQFSRLAPAQADCAAETARTRQFLLGAHLLERGDLLHSVLVTPDDALATLSARCASGPENTFHLIPLAMAFERCGVPRGPAGTALLADTLLLQLLARHPLHSHYPCGPDARYFRLWQVRAGLYASALTVAACALVWTGFNLSAYAEADVAAASLAEENRHFTTRYRSAMAPLAPTAAPTADMRAAVMVDRLLADQSPTPLAMLSLLSAALDQSPQIQLVSLAWQVEAPAADGGAHAGQGAGARTGNGAATGASAVDAAMAGAMAQAGPGGSDFAATGETGAPPDAAPVPSALLGIPVKPRQSLRVEAEVRLERADARGVVDSMQAFARQLARHPRLAVVIERPVLDVRPDVKLSGRASVEAPPPSPFTLVLGWSP
ncbi:MAG: hypothetical protein K2X55_25835 [Burkholderiaceae bacterium]|nr:hypothetical protein [Burkholderiaceae bacterium]